MRLEEWIASVPVEAAKIASSRGYVKWEVVGMGGRSLSRKREGMRCKRKGSGLSSETSTTGRSWTPEPTGTSLPTASMSAKTVELAWRYTS